MSLIVEKMRAAIPGVLRKPSPTTQMIARFSFLSSLNQASPVRHDLFLSLHKCIVKRQRHADFRSGHNVDRGAVFSKYFKQCAQKSVTHRAIREDVTCTVVTPVLWAIAFTVCGDFSVLPTTRVLPLSCARALNADGDVASDGWVSALK